MKPELDSMTLDNAQQRLIDAERMIGGLPFDRMVALVEEGLLDEITSPTDLVKVAEVYAKVRLSLCANLERGETLLKALIKGNRSRFGPEAASRFRGALLACIENLVPDLDDALCAEESFELLKFVQTELSGKIGTAEDSAFFERLATLTTNIKNAAVVSAQAIEGNSTSMSDEPREQLIRFLALCGLIESYGKNLQPTPELGDADLGALRRVDPNEGHHRLSS